LSGKTYEELAAWRDDARVRAEPFDAIELELSALWEKEGPPSAKAGQLHELSSALEREPQEAVTAIERGQGLEVMLAELEAWGERESSRYQDARGRITS